MGKIFSDSLQVLYVTLYQLWYAQGYQEFAGIESSVTTKVNSIINCPLLKCIDWKTVSFCLLLGIIISKEGNKAMFVSGLYMIPQPGISCYHEPVQCGKLINNIFTKIWQQYKYKISKHENGNFANLTDISWNVT